MWNMWHKAQQTHKERALYVQQFWLNIDDLGSLPKFTLTILEFMAVI